MSSIPKRQRIAGLVVVGLIVALVVINIVATNWDSLRPVHTGQVAPDFSLPRIAADGRLSGDLALSSLQGSVVIIDFWATWCGPCTSAMPVLEEMAILYGDKGVRVLSVNTEGFGMARAARAMAGQLSPSALLVSDDGSAGRLYNVSTIPHMLVIDRQGTVRWVKRGFGSASGLRSDLRTVIEELL